MSHDILSRFLRQMLMERLVQTERTTGRKTDTQSDRKTATQPDRHPRNQTDRQTDTRQAERDAGRKAGSSNIINFVILFPVYCVPPVSESEGYSWTLTPRRRFFVGTVACDQHISENGPSTKVTTVGPIGVSTPATVKNCGVTFGLAATRNGILRRGSFLHLSFSRDVIHR
jgi:hypothetical protein